jgi:hypothetical protein
MRKILLFAAAIFTILSSFSQTTLEVTDNGNITITTLDKTNKIIAGTFYFEAYNTVQNKTVNISEGKFRLQYRTT